jgi:RNA polymerase sigma factor (sigma-70 family)
LATLAAPGISATARSRIDVTDHDLVEAVRAGDDHAFERLYHRYHRRIAGYVFGMVHDHGRAEDLTQEVFVSALRRMRQTDRPIAFKPWIYEIAKNASIDAFRRSKRAEEISYDAGEGLAAADHVKLAATGPSPDVAVDTKQRLTHLCGAFGGLSEAHHRILVMRELEGLSYREIGERLGMSRPSVESTLFRARRRLTEEYEELVTGERCLRIQGIIAGVGGDAAGGSRLGMRDTRRVASHISHCRPCRRDAALAGLDAAAMARRPAAAKIAAFLPLPAFLRRRWLPAEGYDSVASGQVAQKAPTLAHMSVTAAQYGDQTVAGWMKAVAVATAVTVAGVGTGAADHGAGVTRHRDAPTAERPAVAAAAAGNGAMRASSVPRRPAASSRTVAGQEAPEMRRGGSAARAARPSAGTGGSGGADGGAGPVGMGSGGGAMASAGSSGSASGVAEPGTHSVTEPIATATNGVATAATGVEQTITDAVGSAAAAAGAATGGTTALQPSIVAPDVTPLTQAPAGTPAASTVGDVVKTTTGVAGQAAGGQAGGAVNHAGEVVGIAVDTAAGGIVGGT